MIVWARLTAWAVRRFEKTIWRRAWGAAFILILPLIAPLTAWAPAGENTEDTSTLVERKSAEVVIAQPAERAVASTGSAIRIVVDGRPLPTDPPPWIASGRTMVPVRAVSEGLGARVVWDEVRRTVTVERGERFLRLYVGERLVCFAPACEQAGLLDVPAQIRDGRTFVPLRFVSEGLGSAVQWDGELRRVHIASEPGSAEPVVPAVRLTSPKAGETVRGRTPLGVESDLAAAEVRYFLLDPETGRGPLLARGPADAGDRLWLPDPLYDGQRLLAAALYDAAGNFLGGDVRPVRQETQPRVVLQGIAAGSRVDGPRTVRIESTFAPTHVRYELRDVASGQSRVLAEAADPYGEFTWSPRFEDRGQRQLSATAFDRLGRAHPADPVTVSVDVARRLSVTGISDGAVVEGPVHLGISANFPVAGVRYVFRDRAGEERTLAQREGAGGFRWFPGPNTSGPGEIYAVVTDSGGGSHTTPRISVTVRGDPKLLIADMGPDQVLAGEVKLRAFANVPLRDIRFDLLRSGSGEIVRIAGGSDPDATYSWTPAAHQAGTWAIRAEGNVVGGGIVRSEPIPIRIHTGPIYGKQPFLPREAFVEFASRLAQQSRDRTGMSAALQVAQAILETGWGQSIPVDRYTGQRSQNLFGIKGTGPAGSVTATTWEEYQGQAYTVDASFRAYHSGEQSWEDHKRLLLEAARYQPFREVMHHDLQGAWALRRAGYATDSAYPLKLIDIIKRYDLHELDQIGP